MKNNEIMKALLTVGVDYKAENTRVEDNAIYYAKRYEQKDICEYLKILE